MAFNTNGLQSLASQAEVKLEDLKVILSLPGMSSCDSLARTDRIDRMALVSIRVGDQTLDEFH